MYKLLSRHNLLFTEHLDEALSVIGNSYEPHLLTEAGNEADGEIVFNHAELGELAFTYMRAAFSSRVTPQSHQPIVHVKIPLTGRGGFQVGSGPVTALNADLGLIYIPSPETSIRVAAGGEELNVRIPARAIAEIAGADALPARLGPLLDLRRPRMRSWVRLVRSAVVELDAESSVITSTLVARYYEQLVISSLLAAHALPGPVQAAGTLRTRAVRQAIELVEEYPDRPWRLIEIAQAVGVSVPQLQDAFRRQLGIGPLAALRRARLYRAHAELMSADPELSTVGDIARNWGFAHQGRFAEAFRREFGMTPREVLYRA